MPLPGGRLLILDFLPQHSEETHKGHTLQHGNHAFLAQLLHAGKEMGGLQDLPTVMKEVGFSQIETGGTKFRSLGFAIGRIGTGQVEQ